MLFLDVLSDIFIFVRLLFMTIFCYVEIVLKNFHLTKKYFLKSIENKVVLITGAAGGIGKCLVEELISHGCVIICVDSNKKSLASLENEIDARYPEQKNKIFYLNADITSTHQIETIYKQVKELGHCVDILVNNAGIMNKGKTLTELNENEIINIFNVNVISQFWLCKVFLPHMMEQNQGHIVNMSSSLGVYGCYKLTDYCATKFAVYGFTESLRVELKTLNRNNQIKVSVVCPFHVKTSLFNGFELPTLKWLNTSVTAQAVAKDIVNGIRLEREIIGCPSYNLFLFSAIKYLMPTKVIDRLKQLIGFDRAIDSIKI